jgi:arylsulfatase A-like enzyme
MAAARKNILLISLDDAAAYWPLKTAFGAPLHTPNLDRICAASTAFRAAYCQAPICGPSRASFMTGLTPPQLGIYDNSIDVFDRVTPQQMFSHALREAGYHCSSGGKVHHRYKPLRRPHHNALYHDTQKRFDSDMHMPPDVDKKRYGGNRGGWGTTDPKDDGIYHDHQSAESAIRFLDEYDGEAPFYREVGFYSPHGPHYTPARFKEMYDQAAFRRPAEWAQGYSRNAHAEATLPPNVDPGDVEWWQASVRNYFSALSHGDHHLGRVWDALKASRHAEDTLVIVVSDHGFHLGNLDRYKKTTLWEQVAGVPVILHDPARPEPREVQDPVALLDIGPTVLDYAGLAAPADRIGRSLRPLAEGGSAAERAVATFYFDNVSIRKGHHRLIRYADGTTQLHDLRTDYWQLRDLGEGHPAHGPMLAALVETCAAYGCAA